MLWVFSDLYFRQESWRADSKAAERPGEDTQHMTPRSKLSALCFNLRQLQKGLLKVFLLTELKQFPHSAQLMIGAGNVQRETWLVDVLIHIGAVLNEWLDALWVTCTEVAESSGWEEKRCKGCALKSAHAVQSRGEKTQPFHTEGRHKTLHIINSLDLLVCCSLCSLCIFQRLCELAQHRPSFPPSLPEVCDLWPVAAALWIGELVGPAPEGAAPCWSSSDTQETWPRAQASDSGVCPSTVELFTWRGGSIRHLPLTL